MAVKLGTTPERSLADVTPKASKFAPVSAVTATRAFFQILAYLFRGNNDFPEFDLASGAGVRTLCRCILRPGCAERSSDRCNIPAQSPTVRRAKIAVVASLNVSPSERA